MCGINLLLNLPEGLSAQAIVAMMEATSHRGPDASNYTAVAPGTFLAANRLKISGMEDAANQPLFTADQQQVLAWNGALYNFGDLRNRLLRRGVVMRGGSDSEVLLHWLTLFGEEGVRDLQGMFSLVFVDRSKEKVLIARDLTGQKPLYFSQSNGGWLFSSEIRGILASGLVPKRLDRSQFMPYFYLRHTLPSKTFFEQIRQFPAGKVLVLGYNGRERASFWLSIKGGAGMRTNIARFEELLTDSVMTHFHAEVPVGIILSGGADSTLLYQLWYNETGIPLRSYTVAFEGRYEREFSDAVYARQVAASFRGEHREIKVSPKMFLEHWEPYCKGLDQPVGDSAGFLTWMIAKEARRDVKVLVSGAGADELLGGYNRHKAFLNYLNYSPALNKIRWMNRLPLLPAPYRKYLSGIAQDPMETYCHLAALERLPRDLLEYLKGHTSNEGVGLKAALSYDRKLYLIEDVLKVLDNSCMAFGIEGRSPYLDYPILAMFDELSEAAQQALIGKKWVKELLTSKGQEAVAKRSKLGFGLPILGWYKHDGAFRSSVLDTLSRFDTDFGADLPPEMRKLTQSVNREMERRYLQVWNLYLLASWIYRHGS
ncbi:asparagine synthase (glutamine-hydrolyzing) [Lunatimonas salinarum]|uniref:asparagine synthase (glutamine-hydrolyzing) n=1 Tax=Lunatimonas salinarum TaxID=1774590 RepID=UPI001AE0DFD1|nr:asparagine synthase (glutamine-hydrolyzing) [Lunatimonas salinarum]